ARLTELYEDLGRDTELLRLLERRIQTHPLKAELLRRLGAVAERTGQNERALSAWREVLTTSPSDREAPEHLVSLLQASPKRAEPGHELADALGKLVHMAAANVADRPAAARYAADQAHLLAESGRLADAASGLEKVLVDVDPSSRAALAELRSLYK